MKVATVTAEMAEVAAVRARAVPRAVVYVAGVAALLVVVQAVRARAKNAAVSSVLNFIVSVSQQFRRWLPTSTYTSFDLLNAWRMPSFPWDQRDGLDTDRALILGRFLFCSRN